MADILVVDVTQNDIDNGTRKSTGGCPIALAIQRTTGNPGAWVGLYSVGTLKTDRGRVTHTHRTSREAYEFISDFDNDIPVTPATFTFQPITIQYNDPEAAE